MENFRGVFDEEPRSPGAEFAAETTVDSLNSSPSHSRVPTLDHHKFPGNSPMRYGGGQVHTVTPPTTTAMWSGAAQNMLESGGGVPPPGDKPTRPLSAYNFFFQLERQRIISSPESERDTLVRYTEADVARVAKLQQEKINSKKPKAKRSHRKTHGKISFGDLARTIANKWKRLDEAGKAIFEKSSSVEKERYRRELAEWNKKQKKWKEATSRMTSSLHQHHRFFSNNVTPTQEPRQTMEATGDLETLMHQQAKLLQDSGFMADGISDIGGRGGFSGGRSSLDSLKNSPSGAFSDRMVMGTPGSSPRGEQNIFGHGSDYDDASFAAQQQLQYQQRMWWAEQQRQAQLKSSREQSESALLMRHQMMMMRQTANNHPYGYDKNNSFVPQGQHHNHDGFSSGLFDDPRRSDHHDTGVKHDVPDNFDFGDHAGDILGNSLGNFDV